MAATFVTDPSTEENIPISVDDPIFFNFQRMLKF